MKYKIGDIVILTYRMYNTKYIRIVSKIINLGYYDSIYIMPPIRHDSSHTTNAFATTSATGKNSIII